MVEAFPSKLFLSGAWAVTNACDQAERQRDMCETDYFTCSRLVAHTCAPYALSKNLAMLL